MALRVSLSSVTQRGKAFLLPRFPKVFETVQRLRYGKDYRTRVFRRVYREAWWGAGESLSGPGSSLSETAAIRNALPGLFRRHGVASLLDAPCGDHNWMREVDLSGIRYVGLDIVPEVIERCRKRFGNARKTFVVGDLVETKLPTVDLILCRECLQHMPLDDAVNVLANIRRSGARWLLASTYLDATENAEGVTGGSRPTNLALPPFGLGEPVEIVYEHADRRPGNHLGLWRLRDD